MGILGLIRGFTKGKRKITLFFILTTWVPLCDGQCRDDAVDPLQSSVRHGNTVVEITRRGKGYGLLGLGGHDRPGCSLPGKDLLHMDGLNLGSLCPHPHVDFPPSNSIAFPIYASAGHLTMSSSEGDQRNDAVTGTETGRSFVKTSVQSFIKALSGSASKTVITPIYLATGGARRTDRDIGGTNFSVNLLTRSRSFMRTDRTILTTKKIGLD
jgi:hypothetical protein